MEAKRLVPIAIAFFGFMLPACSGPTQGPPAPYVTPFPSATPTAVGATPTPVPSGTATPVGTPTPTPAPSGSPAIRASLSSIVVCTQVQMTCAQDLNPYAASGEGAAVLILGATGKLSYSNTGGSAIGTITSQVYKSTPTSTEYEVFYKSATASPATDTLEITDAGTQSSVTIPVTIISPGADQGDSFFALYTSSGFVCPGQQVVFETRTQGNTTVTLATPETSLIAIGQNRTGNFALGILEPGSGTVTATAGASTVVYPANVPKTGFTSSC